MMASAKRVSREAFDDLCRMIQHWNENRLELFEISMPNENLEFEGIMRFYFQNDNPKAAETEKVATKCIRVSNSATTEMVIKSLVQKFRPDMKMLTNNSYALYEVHANQDERKLESNENPLLVQLSWSRGDRDGRFLLRSESDPKSSQKKGQRKKHTKRVKKSKKERVECEVGRDEEDGGSGSGRIARSLYNIMPESRFTRSISIKNRRNLLSKHTPDKLQRKENFGNEFKVHADFVLPDAPPSIAILINEKDTAAQVVKSALDKYGIREDATKFCLVQVIVPSFGSEPHLNVDFDERILGDNEHPSQVYNEWVGGAARGTISQFQLRRRSTVPRIQRESRSRSISPEDDPSVPALVEIFQGAQSPPQSPRRFELSLEMTEIGSNVALLDAKSYICLTSSGIKPRHCVISSVNGIFTISPLDKTASIFVNGKFIKQPEFLPHNAEVKLGDREMFRFFAPVENKLFTSSMHTLPSSIGRPGSSRGTATSPSRQERKSSLPRSDNISKAYSVEDFCSPGFTSNRLVDGRLKDRAFSEHNLKVDDRSSSGYGSGRVQRKFSEPNVMAEDGHYLAGSRSKYGGSDSHFGTFPSSNKKKRHMAALAGDKEEGAEQEWVLPASLSFYQAQEGLLLQMMISEVNGYLLTFKLAPACALYMVLKHHLSPEFQPASSSDGRKCLSLTIKNIIVQFKKSIKESRNIAGALAFWMANSSEFLHLVTRDPQLMAFSSEIETPLTQIIHTAFKYFTSSMTRELGMFLPAFYDESMEADSEEGYISGGESTTSGGTGKDPEMASLNRSPLSRHTSLTGMYWSVAGSKVRRRGRPTIGDILTTLSSTISLLKRCRVNATLSILIFSQLFRYISAKLFNKMLSDGKLCTRAAAVRMCRRLDRVKEWAEKEGMELPAEDHLCMVTQALSLLQSVKKLPEEAHRVHLTCPNLNSVQVQTLLHHCSLADTEQTINPAFAEQLILFAESHVDDAYRHEDKEPGLEEDPNVELPFSLPQRGYYTDSLKGIPSGLHDYLEPVISSGLCKLTIAKDENPQGIWVPPEREKVTSPAYSGSMSNIQAPSTHPLPQSKAPPPQSSNRLVPVPTSVQDVVVTQVNIKKEANSLGISIIGGKNSAMHGDIGIFVKSMVEGGAAHVDGRIHPGDQILAVDNFSLDGCMQEEAARVLRSTGKVVNLTVAKQTALLYGLSHLIGQPSPRYGRKSDRANDASAQARKALKKQRREQRERQHQERQQQRDFRLERRKPQPDRQHNMRTQDHYPSSVHSHHSTDQRLPPYPNPQFAKWIMEQNPRYYSELGSRTSSELDLESSVSSLANIPERDQPVNTSELSFLESNRYNYELGDRSRDVYRPPTPPVRDSSPTKMPEPRSSSYMHIGSSVTSDSRPSSEAASKLSELMRIDQETRLPTTSKPRGSYRAEFGSVSSQLTMESQSMLTPFSQQVSSQQQQQHLDKLSMDVMQHTQLSGTSFQGITSLIPKISHHEKTGPTGGEVPLNRKGLKEFEMDDIALEKQRIQLMFYEEQKQKERLEREQLAKVQNAQTVGQQMESEDEEEINDEPLPQEQLRQELDSLEEMVFDQRKKYREIKFSREREELKLKDLETKFREQEMKSGTMMFSSSDPKRWQSDQKRYLRELERVTNEQKEAIQKIQSSERRAKTKLKAYETQASELRQQLHLSTPPAPSPSLAHRSGYESYDTVPSKLTSEYSKKGPSSSKPYPEVDTTVIDSAREHSTVSEQKWSDMPAVPARAMSIESMSAAVFEPPDLAREPLNTISASCLTEPTQDEPRISNWLPYRSSARGTAHSFSSGSRDAQEDLFELERNKNENLTNGFRAVSMSNVEGSQSIPTSEGLQSQSRVERVPLRREQVFDTQPKQTASSERKDSRSEGRGSPSKAPIYAIPEFSEAPQPTYDVPTSGRPAHQQTTFMQAQPTNTQPTGRHYSRNSRSRGVQYTKVFLQPTPNQFSEPNSSLAESSKRDITQNDRSEDPMPYTSPLSPHAPINQRQVTGSERNQSPNNRGSPLVPSPQPSDSHYSVPIPATMDRVTPSPTTQGNVRTPHHGVDSARNQQYHTQALVPNSRPVLETAANGANSPTVYDQPRPQTIPSTHPSSVSTSRPAPSTVYDVPTAARKPPQRSPYEGVGTRQLQVDTVPANRGTNPAPKPNSGHRYGIVKPGMGHSYSRSRPDPMQQPVGLDKVKGLMDRAYKNPGLRHPPERIQRHQTEL